MKVYPLLFDLGAQHPTTRDVANQVKAYGAAAGLPDATHKADGATYQDVTCRSALNPVKGMPFNWTLNPYRGCTHGCHYCFARRYHVQFELDSSDAFSSIILVKLSTKTPGGFSSRARLTRSSGSARCASSTTPASARAS